MLDIGQEQLIAELRSLVEKHGFDRKALLPVLQDVQRKYAGISDFAMQVIADLLGIAPVEVGEVVSFYRFLSENHQGRFVVRLCRTICCDMQGKSSVARQLESELGISFGETTDDGWFTLSWANCLGMCDQGPAMLINDKIFTRVTPQRVCEIIALCRRTREVPASEKIMGA